MNQGEDKREDPSVWFSVFHFGHVRKGIVHCVYYHPLNCFLDEYSKIFFNSLTW